MTLPMSVSCRVRRVGPTGHPRPHRLHQEALQVQQAAVPQGSLCGPGSGGPGGGLRGGSRQLSHMDGYTGARTASPSLIFWEQKIRVASVFHFRSRSSQPILPSCLSMEDVGMLITQAMRNTNVQSSARVLGETVVVSEKFISNCLSLFDDAMQQKAEKVEPPGSRLSMRCPHLRHGPFLRRNW